jgi:hypothetical protein
MSLLATAGACLALVAVLLFILYLISGQVFVLLIAIFPSILAKSITGERGVDFGGKSFVYTILLFLFIALEVLLLSAVFFGLYCLFFGIPENSVHAATVATPVLLSAEKTRTLLMLNQLLLFLESYFLCLFIFFSIKHRTQFSAMKGFIFFSYRILPAVSFLPAFIFLLSCISYFTAGAGEKQIGLFACICGYTYTIYVVYSFIRMVVHHIRMRQYASSNVTPLYWLNTFISFIYNVLFLYFFYQVHTLCI